MRIANGGRETSSARQRRGTGGEALVYKMQKDTEKDVGHDDGEFEGVEYTDWLYDIVAAVQKGHIQKVAEALAGKYLHPNARDAEGCTLLQVCTHTHQRTRTMHTRVHEFTRTRTHTNTQTHTHTHVYKLYIMYSGQH